MGERNDMPIDQERITRVESKVEFLESDHERLQAALLRLADDMHQMALVNAERAEDRRAMERAFSQLELDKAEFARLWARTDAIVEAHAAAERKRMEDALKEKNKWIGELIKTALAIGAAMLLYHLGIHPL